MFAKLKENKKKKDAARIYKTMMKEMVPYFIDLGAFKAIPLINQCIDQLISLNVDLKDIISQFLEGEKDSSRYYIYKTFGDIYFLRQGDPAQFEDILKDIEANPKNYIDEAYCVSRCLFIEIAKHEEQYFERIMGWAEYTDRLKRDEAQWAKEEILNKEKLSIIGLIIIGLMTSKVSLEFLKEKIEIALENRWAEYSDEVFTALSFRVDDEAVKEARLFLTKVDGIPYGFNKFIAMFGRVSSYDGICDIINKELDDNTTSSKNAAWSTWFSAAVGTLVKAIEEVCSLGLGGVKISGDYAINTLIRCIPIPGQMRLSEMVEACLKNIGDEALPHLQRAVENPEQVWSIKDRPENGLWYAEYANEACDPVKMCKSLIQDLE